jgi:hypothetical protein
MPRRQRQATHRQHGIVTPGKSCDPGKPRAEMPSELPIVLPSPRRHPESRASAACSVASLRCGVGAGRFAWPERVMKRDALICDQVLTPRNTKEIRCFSEAAAA